MKESIETKNWIERIRRNQFISCTSHFLLILSLIAVGLRPILTTVIVADDLIGPFSMAVEAGAGFVDHLRVSWEAASYGHFNYFGQIVGGIVNWSWMQLMLHGIRFSTIYFFTKLLVFVAVIYAASSTIKGVSRLWGGEIDKKKLRLLLTFAMIGSLQLHLVWSNDPVASYPMSGYASVVVGLIALTMAASSLHDPTSIRKAFFAATSLFLAIVYYEMNIALIPAIAILTVTYVFSSQERRTRAFRTVLRTSMIYLVPALLVLELQRRNAAESVAYDGTAIRLSGSMLTTFARLIISSLPYSSWHLASDWIADFPSISDHFVLLFAFGVIAITILFVELRKQTTVATSRVMWWSVPMLVTYWFAATGIQSSTVKVQNEATQIGYVYNFYAIGSIAVSVVAAFVLYSFFANPLKLIRAVPVTFLLIVLCIGQIHVNESIQEKHYQMLPQTRNLLVSFTEQWPLEARCGWLDEWLKMGWPTYYSNAMVSGLERSYSEEFNQPFCGRY
jgi:hypothetical protein